MAISDETKYRGHRAWLMTVSGYDAHVSVRFLYPLPLPGDYAFETDN